MASTNTPPEKQLLHVSIPQPELGSLIRENRKAKKMSQRQLGEQLGVSYQTIANWENGLRVPIAKNLVKLAHALDKPPFFFFRCDEDQQVKPAISTLSENLRNYRKNLGISQVQLSEKTGISLVKIKAYEDECSGLFITNDNLEIISEFLGADPKVLLGYSPTAETLEDGMIKNCLQEIHETAEKLNLLGLQKAAKQMKAIAEIKRYRQ